MKKLVLVIANLMMAATTTYASSKIDFENAKVGQVMSLKKEVVFNEGIQDVTLSTTTLQLPNSSNQKVDVNVSCFVSRGEEGDNCPDYRKTKVSAGKLLTIRNGGEEHLNYDAGNVMTESWVRGSVKKNSCVYSLTFYCKASARRDLYKSVAEIEANEVRRQAAENFNIQEDPTEPTPWP